MRTAATPWSRRTCLATGHAFRSDREHGACHEVVRSEKPNQDEQQAAVREAQRHGMSASEAGASTGAGKQIDHCGNFQDWAPATWVGPPDNADCAT